MRTYLKLSALLVIAVPVIWLWLLTVGYFDIKEHFFSTLREASEAGFVGANKRIPPFLPDSATEIRLAVNTDSSDTWIEFRYSGDGMMRFEEVFSEVNIGEVTFLSTDRIPWWPEELRSASAEKDYRFYSVTKKNASYPKIRPGCCYLAASKDENRAWYWQRRNL